MASDSNITPIRRNVKKGIQPRDCMDAQKLIQEIEETKENLKQGLIDAKDAKVIIDACLKQLNYVLPTLKSIESKSDNDKKSYADALADLPKKKS